MKGTTMQKTFSNENNNNAKTKSFNNNFFFLNAMMKVCKVYARLKNKYMKRVYKEDVNISNEPRLSLFICR